MAKYINKDGLPWAFGIEEAELGNVTGYRTNGPSRVTEVVVSAKSIAEANENATKIVDWNCSLPKGAVIDKVELSATSNFAATGVAIGLADKKGANIKAVLPATAAADFIDGKEVEDLGNIDVTVPSLITLVGTVTAGVGTARIFWTVPKKDMSTDTLIYTK